MARWTPGGNIKEPFFKHSPSRARVTEGSWNSGRTPDTARPHRSMVVGPEREASRTVNELRSPSKNTSSGSSASMAVSALLGGGDFDISDIFYGNRQLTVR